MKRLLFFVAVFYVSFLLAQERKYSTFYYQRTSLFEELPIEKEDIIFLGNSITNGCEWAELVGNPHVKNRGISGDTSMGVYDRLEAVTKGSPSKIFLLIGTNDIAAGLSADTIARNIEMIVDKIMKDTPSTRVYLQSILPVSTYYGMFTGHTSRKEIIPVLNGKLRELALRKGINYVDLYSRFVDPATGEMNIGYTNDGLHLLGKGYKKWIETIQPYIGQ